MKKLFSVLMTAAMILSFPAQAAENDGAYGGDASADTTSTSAETPFDGNIPAPDEAYARAFEEIMTFSRSAYLASNESGEAALASYDDGDVVESSAQTSGEGTVEEE